MSRAALLALLVAACSTFPEPPPHVQDCATWRALVRYAEENAPPGNVTTPRGAWAREQARADGCTP